MRIRGNTVGTPMKRPDFKQTDPKKSDFIKNNPIPDIKEEDEGKIVQVKGGKYGLVDAEGLSVNKKDVEANKKNIETIINAIGCSWKLNDVIYGDQYSLDFDYVSNHEKFNKMECFKLNNSTYRLLYSYYDKEGNLVDDSVIACDNTDGECTWYNDEAYRVIVVASDIPDGLELRATRHVTGNVLETDAKTIIAALNEIYKTVGTIPITKNEETGKYGLNITLIENLGLGLKNEYSLFGDISLIDLNINFENGQATVEWAADALVQLWNMLPEETRENITTWMKGTADAIRDWIYDTDGDGTPEDEDRTIGEAASDKVEKIIDDTKQGLAKVQDWLQDTGEATVKWVAETGKATTEATSKWVNETGEATSKWVNETGEATAKWVGETGEATAKWVGETGEATAKWVNETGKGIGEWFGDTIENFNNFDDAMQQKVMGIAWDLPNDFNGVSGDVPKEEIEFKSNGEEFNALSFQRNPPVLTYWNGNTPTIAFNNGVWTDEKYQRIYTKDFDIDLNKKLCATKDDTVTIGNRLSNGFQGIRNDINGVGESITDAVNGAKDWTNEQIENTKNWTTEQINATQRAIMGVIWEMPNIVEGVDGGSVSITFNFKTNNGEKYDRLTIGGTKTYVTYWNGETPKTVYASGDGWSNEDYQTIYTYDTKIDLEQFGATKDANVSIAEKIAPAAEWVSDFGEGISDFFGGIIGWFGGLTWGIKDRRTSTFALTGEESGTYVLANNEYTFNFISNGQEFDKVVCSTNENGEEQIIYSNTTTNHSVTAYSSLSGIVEAYQKIYTFDRSADAKAYLENIADRVEPLLSSALGNLLDSGTLFNTLLNLNARGVVLTTLIKLLTGDEELPENFEDFKAKMLEQLKMNNFLKFFFEDGKIPTTYNEVKTAIDEKLKGITPNALTPLNEQLNTVISNLTGSTNTELSFADRMIANLKEKLGVGGCECDIDGVKNDVTNLTKTVNEVKGTVDEVKDDLTDVQLTLRGGYVWYLTDDTFPVEDATHNFTFTSNGEEFVGLQLKRDVFTTIMALRFITSNGNYIEVFDSNNGWKNTEYRTITTMEDENLSNIGEIRTNKLNTKDKTFIGAINEVNDKTIDKIGRVNTHDEIQQLGTNDEGISWDDSVDWRDKDGKHLAYSLINKHIPIVAGNNVTFENNGTVVKVNAIENVVGTWVFNHDLTLTSKIDVYFNFTSYDADAVKREFTRMLIDVLLANDGTVEEYAVAYYNNDGERFLVCNTLGVQWEDDMCRTVIINEQPPKDIVALLKTNAIKKEIVGVDKIKSIDTWATGEASNIEIDDGITWTERFSMQDNTQFYGSVIAGGDIGHRVPIEAGNGIEFEVDGNVVKINATGGGSATDDSVVGTWKFNDYLNIPQEFFGNSFKVSFTTTGWGNETIRMDTIYFYDDDGDEIICYYGDDGDYDDIYVNSWSHGYNFNIITITEQPTDPDFITWLKANATKQGEDTPSKPCFEMPQIRFVGMPCSGYFGDVDTEQINGQANPDVTGGWTDLRFTIEIVGGGALQVGDVIQICRMGCYGATNKLVNGVVKSNPKKRKLRSLFNYEIEEYKLDRRFITFDVSYQDKKAKKLFTKYDTHNVNDKTIYFRVRRPKGNINSGSNGGGMTVDAEFSNVVSVRCLSYGYGDFSHIKIT